ncbi:Conserved membrane protein of uncharacterised function [Mycobacterium tuberculosis]|nr:Conserved membrane protein of uncharacterised function [Mycobacterium tuberculosis]
MSGPQGSDPRQPWQPPGQGADHSSDPTVAAGYPWQQQPTQEATWQAPAYTPQYQQPADPAYPQQYPQPTPGYAQPEQFGAQPTQLGVPGQYGNTSSRANMASRDSTASPASTHRPVSTPGNTARMASRVRGRSVRLR